MQKTRIALAYMRLLRSQYWSEDQLKKYQDERLQAVLHSARKIPFYRSSFGSALQSSTSLADLRGLPILERKQVGLLERSVASIHPPGVEFPSAMSGGSTGMPKKFLFSKPHQVTRHAARLRYLRANGWSPRIPNAWIIHLPERGPDSTLIKSPLLWRTRFLSTHFELDEQLSWLLAVDPVHLYSLPSTAGALLDRLEVSGQRLSRLNLILCGGEVVDESLRDKALRVAGVPIRDNYGSSEAFLAWQCPEGSYHVNCEHVVLEIVDDDGQPAREGTLGRVLVTTLRNDVMPLIRYEIGDYAIANHVTCPCGRTLPTIGGVVGRSMTLFRLKSGGLVSPVEILVKMGSFEEIQQFQIVQETIDRCVLYYVSEGELAERSRTGLARNFRAVLGSHVTVRFERVASVSRTPTGKFIPARSLIS